MKKVFRKLRSKKQEQDNAPATSRTWKSNDNLEPSRAQNNNQQPAPTRATGAPGGLAATAPPEQLAALLASPASASNIQDPSSLIQVAPKQICSVCYNFDAAAASNGDPTEKTWVSKEYVVPPGTFINIFLATNYPVVVRLSFGATSTVNLGREAMLEMGIQLQEGQTMNFIITVADATKPAIDIELYRPHLPAEQTTVGDKFFSPRQRVDDE
jgi:hypothetical protein